MIAIDTNLLVYAHRASTPESKDARDAIERAANTSKIGICLPCIGEFWSVVTHVNAIGRPSSPTEAADFIRMIINGVGAKIWYPGEGFEERCFRLAIELGVGGVRFSDLQIGLIAVENGANVIWTHDRKFLKIPRLKIKDPIG